MATKEGLFSLRIVVADFYMGRPTPGLDPTYSDFRGNEIKTLPVIRIFGSNGNGEKTCMHVHGVFPYFYIPFENSETNDATQLIYQIAASLDKAINITLGQAQSSNKHVFKIQLVKGIPFYGYHRKEHQFFKIFLYNPRFIKKAANLFQSGAIIGRVLQPHESHVPYVLQFLIDYNLYGMSFLHVPKEIVMYRQGCSKETPHGLDKEQILHEKISRISTSRHEVDIAAAFILNRFQLLNKGSGNTNPGIESIWQDERSRRNTLAAELNIPPPLEIPCSQDRILSRPTDSDKFYKEALKAKLSNENELNKSINSTILDNPEKKSRFNLSKLLSNSAYPSECSQQSNEMLSNASQIPDHLSNDSIFHNLMRAQSSRSVDSNNFDNSFIDEEIVLSLSQPQENVLSQTLHAEDLELLEVMQQLEEDEGGIDLDSTLAPLSQTPKYSLNNAEDVLNVTKVDNVTCSDDEEDMNDYTMSVETVDKILLELSQPQRNAEPDVCIPQFDGADDSFSTPKKRKTSRVNSKMQNSPRTPKISSGSKYAPLDITIKKSPTCAKKDLTNGDSNPVAISNTTSTTEKLRERILKRKRVLINLNNEFNTITNNNTRANGTVSGLNTDKSFITCELKPRKTRKNSPGRKLETTNVSNAVVKICRVGKTKLKKCEVKLQIMKLDDIKGYKSKESNESESPVEGAHSTPSPVVIHNSESLPQLNASPFVIHSKSLSQSNELNLLNNQLDEYEKGKDLSPEIEERNFVKNPPFSTTTNGTLDIEKSTENHSLTNNDSKTTRIRADETKEIQCNRRRSWSPCDIAREFDKQHNFFPKPGPSGLKNRKRLAKIQKTPAKSTSTMRTRHSAKSEAIVEETPLFESSLEHNDDLSICSFYEKSCFIDSPSLFSDDSPRTPTMKFGGMGPLTSDKSQIQPIIPQSLSQIAVITPKELPPSYEQVQEKMIAFNIPDRIYCEPFYGDDDDVTSKREVGHTVLRIPGKSLNACEQFQSTVPNLNGIDAWRKNMLTLMVGESISGELQTTANIKDYFSNRQRIVISTHNIAPSKFEAVQWLKDRRQAENSESCEQNKDDSPIKVKREKIKMIFDVSSNNDDESDLTQKSITLSPLTPEGNQPKLTTSNKSSRVINSLSQKTPLSALQKFKERRKSRARLSLTKKLERLKSLDSPKSATKLKDAKNDGKIQCIAADSLLLDSEDNGQVSDHSSVGSEQAIDLCSDKVRNILERTSFIKNLTINENDVGHDISFGLSGASLNNTFGFKISLENLQNVKADMEYNYLTVFSMELYVKTRGELKPNPEHDPVSCLFFSITTNAPDTGELPVKSSGCIMVSDGKNPSLNGVETRFIVVNTELELLDRILELCRFWDPDILVGYEIEMSSWGYLLDRAQVLGMDLKAQLSRVPSQKIRGPATDEEQDQFIDFDIELKLCGRILLDVWRLMRSEIALTSYTFENVVYHILHRRCPQHSFSDLTKWYSATNTRWIVLDYYLERVNGTLELLDQLDLIGRTSEMAKLIGIQFYEVFSRGSQFRVESMMLRIAKPKNIVPVSPSIQQRAHMRAPEYLSLILEPKSRFYSDPMIVLDFQSLYPSLIIAYNYCFSTCLGRVEHLGQSNPFEFGASQLRVSPTELKRLIENDLITISPCGVAFVKKEVREGILSRMLKEILDTRLMVKQSMKLHKTNSTLQRVLHSRQLGLKLMANVTYGYTAANFSGRMPCVEVGDSVVSKGRETLERAIKLVESNPDWRAKVVYGDTDSMFVLVAGRSRSDAFQIGAEIAEAVTNDNPKPVKLKLEKVYNPCILQTKKRYVGYMYETADQEKPIYEAKGIETVRRDGCPAVAKMLEKCLRILFETCDVSEIKRYVCRQFTKLLTGNANVQDLIFAKEFRGRNGYKPSACVPALELTRRWLKTDPRNEPRRGERVPFLIVNGPPGLPLIRLVRSPHEFLADEGLKINSIYYITKAIIPPLNRCLLLIGADVNEWFADLPRKHLALPAISMAGDSISNYQNSKKSTISQYFSSTNCVVDCGRHTKSGICTQCIENSNKCTIVLSQKITKMERNYFMTKKICQSCCGRLDNTSCRSLDCPVLFIANLKEREQNQIQYLRKLIQDNFS